MQAIILAGGKGRRLQPYTTVIPKPLMPIGDYPILDIILKQLKRAGVSEVILAVGHMSHLFQAFFQDGRQYGLEIVYSFEKKALGTAGPIALAMDRLRDNFLVMNGDLLTTLNFANLYKQHMAMRSAATVGMYPRQVKIDFGVVEVDGSNRLVRYIEKPTYDFSVSMGINAFNKEWVKPFLIPGEYLDIPDLLMKMQQEGLVVQCYSEACYWLDIGRIDDYHTANEIFEAKRAEFLPGEA
ncbi:MAG: sugar phosphate nucleotidyltransferase [Desulforhabdus sp.]|nr:sugar phosphate nucleotidyltransferase [Desulforhabdus sp.]